MSTPISAMTTSAVRRPTPGMVQRWVVNIHNFPDAALGKAIPYWLYDVTRNTGWVSVGQHHDTASFAVETVRRWWSGEGRATYARGHRLLICADGGGSNGYQSRLWKKELMALAEETDLEITVCHLPPDASGWNKIEHRLFAHITMNWRGKPLTSHEVVVNLIAATTSRQGLRLHAERDTNHCPTGVKVSDDELPNERIRRHRFHGDWNYTLTAPPRP